MHKNDGALQVRIGVVLACLVMAVIQAGRSELLEPHLKVGDEPVFPVVHEHARGDVHGRHQHHAVSDTGSGDDFTDLIGNSNELLSFLRVEPQILGEHDRVVGDRSRRAV